MSYTEKAQINITVSAGDLAEYCFPQGSLGTQPTLERMFEGTSAHKKLQNIYSENESIQYRREVPLETAKSYGSFKITLQGRADGIFYDKVSYYIHEIKSTYCASSSIEKPLKAAHKAQMMIYACIFAKDNGLSEIKCRLSYFCLSDESIVDFEYTFAVSLLEEAVNQMLDDYSLLIGRRLQAYAELAETAQKLEFPFDTFRKGQREGAAQVYSAIKKGKNLFLQAPTGSGKTLMALFPAIKTLSDCNAKIFCLSAKNQTLTVNENAVALLRQKGLKIKSCTVTAKSKCCLCDLQDCTPENCKYSFDFYRKLHDALPEMLKCDNFDFSVIRDFAEKYELCPHELSLALAEEASIVICDYNYLFDPLSHIKRFFDVDGNYIFLIDEAHNLPERGRDMYSASISASDLRETKKKLDKTSRLYRSVARILTELNRLLKLDESLNKDSVIKLNSAIITANDALDEAAAQHHISGEISLYLKDLWRFTQLCEFYDPDYFVLRKRDSTALSLQCLDASAMLESSIKKGNSSILYSATLSPFEFYRNNIFPSSEVFGYNSEYPFNPNALTVLADYSVDTRYSSRDRFFGIIAEKIKKCRASVHGNIVVFFPSYKFMSSVAEFFDDVLIQHSGDDSEARNAFLERFTEKSDTLGFAVMGSHFSEGIDFKHLCGIIIVGVALPQFNEERRLMCEHFEKKYKKGFEYAYVYPGINKVCQSSGRLIRKASDTGFILLIDERFRKYGYLLPPHWKIQAVKDNDALIDALAAFGS